MGGRLRVLPRVWLAAYNKKAEAEASAVKIVDAASSARSVLRMNRPHTRLLAQAGIGRAQGLVGQHAFRMTIDEQVVDITIMIGAGIYVLDIRGRRRRKVHVRGIDRLVFQRTLLAGRTASSCRIVTATDDFRQGNCASGILDDR
jgi:hypothetical protein